jgi:AraC-like DNA-binding protein
MFREHFGRDRVKVEPVADHPLCIDAFIAKYPGVGLVWGRRSPLRSDFSDGSDRLLFSLRSPAVAMQFGQEIEVTPGDAVILSGADPGCFVTLQSGPIMTLEFPDRSLARSLGDPRRSFARTIRKDEPAFHLLRTYVRSFLSLRTDASPAIRNSAATHLRDLACLAAGSARESGEVATLRSLPAARLHAIKEDVIARLADDLCIDEVAVRHGVSARYVRMLFEREGATFSEFVRDERLSLARRLLLSPCSAQCSVSDIAYSVGFNDLSYFNRSFRRRFGCSPREMRNSSS